MSATSSDQAVLPNGNILLGGSGASRTLNATPVAAGSVTVTVTVSDGSLQARETFVLTVIHVAPGVVAETAAEYGPGPVLAKACMR